MSDRAMAINVLKVQMAVHEELDNRGEVEALDMAIKALEALDAAGDTISRSAAVEAVEFGITYAKAINKNTGEVKRLFTEGNKALEQAAERIKELPSAHPEKRTEERTETHECDLISRRAAIDFVDDVPYIKEHPNIGLLWKAWVEQLPPAQPERLTDDDFETIRIHLNAYKEKLCNQQRWEEADEYQRILDRFMSFASAQPEIVRCKDCKYWNDEFAKDKSTCWLPCMSMTTHRKWYCGSAERRTDEAR